MDSTTKVCRRCGEEKSLDDFWMRWSSADGHHYYCKKCQGRLDKESRDRRRPPPGPTAEERFWSHVQKGLSKECWPWTGPVHPHSKAPRISVNSRSVDARRFSCMLAGKEFPERSYVKNRCGNRSCVNPDHNQVYKNDGMRERGEKWCPGCKQPRPLAEFERANGNGSMAGICRSCGNSTRLLRRFRITPAQYAERLQGQGGACAICGIHPKEGEKLHVDHDAESGFVRGLLCSACNLGIGQLRHDVPILSAAISYLWKARLVIDATAAQH